jgi:hypothetical protein
VGVKTFANYEKKDKTDGQIFCKLQKKDWKNSGQNLGKLRQERLTVVVETFANCEKKD